MTNETTENFWKVWSEFKWPDLDRPSYRLYYNSDGTPKCYSMEILLDKYIEVDAETYALRPWNIRVIDGKIKHIDPPVTVQKLKPNQLDGTPCDPRDVCVVVQQNKPHIKWNKTTNEIS